MVLVLIGRQRCKAKDAAIIASNNSSIVEAADSTLKFASILYHSGRIASHEYDIFRKLEHAEKSTHPHGTIGDTVLVRYGLPHSTTTMASKVLNISELLVSILQQLDHGDFLKTIRGTCEGFKTAVEMSPILRKRTSLALRAHENDQLLKFNVAVKALTLDELSSASGTIRTYFHFPDRATVNRYRTSITLRSLRVYDEAGYELEIEVTYKRRGTGDVPRRFCKHHFPYGDSSHIHKHTLRSTLGNELTFGATFDTREHSRAAAYGAFVGWIDMKLTPGKQAQVEV